VSAANFERIALLHSVPLARLVHCCFFLVRTVTTSMPQQAQPHKERTDKTKHNFNKTDVLATNLATSELIIICALGLVLPVLLLGCSTTKHVYTVRLWYLRNTLMIGIMWYSLTNPCTISVPEGSGSSLSTQRKIPPRCVMLSIVRRITRLT